MSDTYDPLKIGEHTIHSRIILGTGKYKTMEEMERALEASGTDMVTVAVRRVKLGDQDGPPIIEHIDRSKYKILPNTAGCTTAKDAVRVARLAREALDTDLVKLEVIGDPATLYPDNAETVAAAETLVKDGFTVMPYTSCDPVTCRRLIDVGCPVIMPLAAPIGSGLGNQVAWRNWVKWLRISRNLNSQRIF